MYCLSLLTPAMLNLCLFYRLFGLALERPVLSLPSSPLYEHAKSLSTSHVCRY